MTEEKRDKNMKDRMALNIPIHKIDPNKFNRVLSFDANNEMQETLAITHKRASEVKAAKINIYIHK